MQFIINVILKDMKCLWKFVLLLLVISITKIRLDKSMMIFSKAWLCSWQYSGYYAAPVIKLGSIRQVTPTLFLQPEKRSNDKTKEFFL